MMYHFVKLRSGYLTVTVPDSGTRYMCFRHKNDAGACRAYVADFKRKYGIWPNMDMNLKNIDIKPILKERKNVEREIEIESLGEDDMRMFASLSASNILYCHSFGVIENGSKNFTLSFSGQEIDFLPDLDIYMSSLTERLNILD